MGDQPHEEQPTVPAWATSAAQPEPTAPLPEYPLDQPPQQPGAESGFGSSSWPGAPGGYGGGYPGSGAPYASDAGGYPGGYPGGPTPPRQNGGRTAVAVISALAVLGTAITAVVYSTGGKSGQTPVAFQTGTPIPTQTGVPLISASPDPGDQESSQPSTDPSDEFDSPTADAFDWSSLNNSDTDPTPFTQDSLLPQTFTDSQNITYTLEAAGEKKCVQSTMSQSVQKVLNQYSCKEAMTGSYLVDSSVDKVTTNNNILVSIQIWPFPDAATADKAEKALAKVSSKQFSIWCPTSGPGAAPCNSQNYYNAATWWSLQSDYRYVVEATAVYTNMTQDTSVAYKWEKTATSEAVKEAGPQVYADDLD